jgi:choloylglycine hydrolase
MNKARDARKNKVIACSILLGLIAITCKPLSTSACSHAFWNNNKKGMMIVGRTMDLPFVTDEARMVLYPRGIEKDGMPGDKNSLKWKSKYGSVAIASFPNDGMPIADGMNEEGLNVNMLALDGANYGERNLKLPGVCYTLWAQYFLDNCKTVQEAIDHVNDFQIVPKKVADRMWGLHLAFSDPSGDSAVVEYIDGKAVIHHGKQYNVMTNEPTYDVQLENLKKYKSFGGNLPLPGDIDPLSRFVRASTFLKTLPEAKDDAEAVAEVYSVMRSTAVPYGAEDSSDSDTDMKHPSLWFTLADLNNLNYFFQAASSPNLYWVNLKELPLAAGDPVRAIDAYDMKLNGDISSLIAKQPAQK